MNTASRSCGPLVGCTERDARMSQMSTVPWWKRGQKEKKAAKPQRSRSTLLTRLTSPGSDSDLYSPLPILKPDLDCQRMWGALLMYYRPWFCTARTSGTTRAHGGNATDKVHRQDDEARSKQRSFTELKPA